MFAIATLEAPRVGVTGLLLGDPTVLRNTRGAGS